jgi:hypothetical protein
MIGFLIFWEQTHRVWIWAVIALSLWAATYLIYLRQDITLYFRKRRAERWGVDMATRTITSGRKPLV